jgi:uncharacterized protein YbjT (DUF2867 family)
MKIRAIITGVTGMVGEGVLHECIQHPDVEHVLVIGRKPCGVTHAKLTEIVHANFHDLSTIEAKLHPYNACFFCLGVSSVGMKEAEYHRLTYDLTMHVAQTLSKLNRDMTFCYVSGSGTDSSEAGKSMWARVKGKTENALTRLPFKAVYLFRPGYIHPTKGLKNTLGAYRALSWLYPVFKIIFPQFVGTLADIGLAMIHSVTKGYDKKILEVPDIAALAQQK